jgi:hypothetical protein
LRAERAIFTVPQLMEVVRNAYTPNAKCEEVQMVSDWATYLRDSGTAEAGDAPLSRELQFATDNQQFKICKNRAGDVVVYSKQFARSPEWEANDSNGDPIDGCKVLLREPEGVPSPYDLLPFADGKLQALNNLVYVLTTHQKLLVRSDPGLLKYWEDIVSLQTQLREGVKPSPPEGLHLELTKLENDPNLRSLPQGKCFNVLAYAFNM